MQASPTFRFGALLVFAATCLLALRQLFVWWNKPSTPVTEPVAEEASRIPAELAETLTRWTQEQGIPDIPAKLFVAKFVFCLLSKAQELDLSSLDLSSSTNHPLLPPNNTQP